MPRSRKVHPLLEPLTALSPRARALASWTLQLFAPPNETGLAAWVESNIVLPPEQNVRHTEETKNWPYMVEPLNAIGDTATEQVTIMKSARLGFTKGLVFAAAAKAVLDPCPIIILMPTDDDAIGIAVDDLEPIFAHSPALKGVIKERRNNGRSTILRKQIMGGGSIKVLSGRAPRKLRRHDCRVLLIDEADAFEITKEGDAIAIAKRRTMAQSPRKIVVGGTPTEEGGSVVERDFEDGTKEIFEVSCYNCKEYNEIHWTDIEWDNDTPGLTDAQRGKTAQYKCPHCKSLIHERHKSWMVKNHRWRALAPEVKGHRSFRINALVSLLPNASWAKLVDEYLKAKRGGPALMQPFVNLVLGTPYRTSNARVDAQILAGRIEPWGLGRVNREPIIPPEVLLITMGVDVQPDRLEMTLLGWALNRNAPLVLGKNIIDGNTLEAGVWKTLDAFTRRTWLHPNGWPIGIDATAVDSGGKAGTTEIVYDWCYPRLERRIYAIKGVPGKRKLWEKSKKVKGDMRAYNIAVDIAKPEVMHALSLEPFVEKDGEIIEDLNAMRYSDQLDDDWFEQATNEIRRIKYKGLRAEYVHEPKYKGAPVEALDCLVYGWAVRRAPGVLAIDLHARAARVPPPPLPPGTPPPPPAPSGGDWGAQFAEL